MRELGRRRRFLDPLLDAGRLINAPRGYAWFVRDLRRHRALEGAAPRRELYRQLHDRLPTSAERARVLAPGGQLLFSGPVGVPRTCFNAHRIHAPQDVVSMFDGLTLTEFGGIDDTGRCVVPRQLDDLAGERYACGLFRFTRS